MWGMAMLVLIQDVVDAKNPVQTSMKSPSTTTSATQDVVMTTSSMHTLNHKSSSSSETLYSYLIFAAAIASFVVYFALTTKPRRSARVPSRRDKRSMHV